MLYIGGDIIMKKKFIKCLNLGICCIMFSALISAYIPQKDTTTLTYNQIPRTNSMVAHDDPPFH